MQRKERVSMKKKSILSLEAYVALAIIGIIAILSLEGFVRQDIPALGARFPIVVFSVVVITGLLEVRRCVAARRRENAAKEGSDVAAKPPKSVFANRGNFLAISGMIVLYSIVMHLLGFIISSILLFIAFVLYFKFSRVTLFIICSAVATVAVYYCFTELMHVRLPVGLLLER